MRHVIPLVLLVAGYSLSAARDLPMQAYLQPDTQTGCVVADGAIRLPDPLPTQADKAPIVIEAEGHASVEWQNEQGRAYAAPDAAGGQAVAFAHELLYHFAVTQPGYYWYWQRAWLPRLASWCHGVQVDDAIPFELAFGTRPEDKAEQWFWVRGPRHYLKAGVHSVAIRNLHNGKRLDRFVLSPEETWQPDAVGPPATAVQATDQGEYVSRPLAPIAWRRWTRLSTQRTGEARVALDLGNGRTVEVSPEGTLAGIATPLRVRVVLKRDPGQPSPTVRFGPVEYEADADAFHVLRNRFIELLLEQATGRICGLRDLRTGRRYLPDGTPGTLFEIETKACDSPEVARVSSEQAQIVVRQVGVRAATITFAPAGGGLEVATRLELGSDWIVRTTLTVHNRTDRDVVAVHFPRLAGAQCGQDGTDDVLCLPSLSSELISRPGRAGTRTASHPMRATIGFCDLHDAEGGLILAPTDFPMVFSEFTSEPDSGGESVCLRLARRDRVRSGASATYQAVFGVHAGDWHTAADWYREWYAKRVGRPRIPAWVYESDGYVTSDEPEEMAGLGFTHLQLWRETGHGACPTYYYPNPAFRSEAGWKELSSAWRGLGGHLGVYFHGNSLSRSYVQAEKIYGIARDAIPESKRPPDWDWFVRNSAYGPERKPPDKMDMSKVAEAADAEEYPGMAWEGSQWREYLWRWAIDVYLREYGLDTPYWDTMACHDAQEYNPHLGRNGEGRDAMARYRFLCEAQAAGRKVSSGFHQTVEGGSELLGLVAGQLESNFVQNLEVARYTHPDQVYYVGHSNGWWTPPQTELAAAMAFWLNAKLDLIRLTPEVMDIVRVRRWLAPWLYDSRFLDNQGLQLTSDRIRGALHLHQSRRGKALLATIMNWQRIEGQRATLDVGRYMQADEVRAFIVVQGRDPAPLALPAGQRPDRPGVCTVDLPVAPVTGLLFLERPDRATPVVQAWQEEERLRLRVFDPAARKRAFRVSLASGEAELAGTPVIDSGAGCAYGADLSYANFAGLGRRLHADVTLADGRLVLRTRALVAPRFEDPDFERPRFSADQAHSGKRSQRLDPGGLVHYPLELVPGHRYRISLWVLRQEQKGSVMANVHLHLANRSHHFGWQGKAGEWTRVETVYEMSGREQPHLYLYNWQGTTLPAWFDGVQLDDLGTQADAGGTP